MILPGLRLVLKNIHIPVLPSCRGFLENPIHLTPSLECCAFIGYRFGSGALVAGSVFRTKEVRLQHRSMMKVRTQLGASVIFL